MLNNKFLKILGCMIIPNISFAVFCPTNFSQINMGDTVEQVQQACGKPDSIEIKEVKPDGAQEWDYYVNQTVSTVNMSQTQGTLKTQFTFNPDDKLISISVNGIGVGATAICGPNVELGDDKKKVKAACGEPVFINKQGTVEPPPQKVTILTYATTPPAKLTFVDGKLSEMK